MKVIISIISLLVCVSCTSLPVSKEINPLLGSWKMKEIHYIGADATHSQTEAFEGTFMFTPKRYMIMYNPWKNPRVAFESLSKPTDKEIIASFKTIVYNSGSYIHDANTVTTTASIAKVPGFEGGKQFYEYSISGNRLDITMFDETYPDGSKPEWSGKTTVRFVLIRE